MLVMKIMVENKYVPILPFVGYLSSAVIDLLVMKS